MAAKKAAKKPAKKAAKKPAKKAAKKPAAKKAAKKPAAKKAAKKPAAKKAATKAAKKYSSESSGLDPGRRKPPGSVLFGPRTEKGRSLLRPFLHRRAGRYW